MEEGLILIFALHWHGIDIRFGIGIVIYISLAFTLTLIHWHVGILAYSNAMPIYLGKML